MYKYTRKLQLHRDFTAASIHCLVASHQTEQARGMSQFRHNQPFSLSGSMYNTMKVIVLTKPKNPNISQIQHQLFIHLTKG